MAEISLVMYEKDRTEVRLKRDMYTGRPTDETQQALTSMAEDLIHGQSIAFSDLEDLFYEKQVDPTVRITIDNKKIAKHNNDGSQIEEYINVVKAVREIIRDEPGMGLRQARDIVASARDIDATIVFFVHREGKLHEWLKGAEVEYNYS